MQWLQQDISNRSKAGFKHHACGDGVLLVESNRTFVDMAIRLSNHSIKETLGVIAWLNIHCTWIDKRLRARSILLPQWASQHSCILSLDIILPTSYLDYLPYLLIPCLFHFSLLFATTSISIFCSCLGYNLNRIQIYLLRSSSQLCWGLHEWSIFSC